MVRTMHHTNYMRLYIAVEKKLENKRLIQKVSTFRCKKKSSKVSYKILLLTDSTFFELFFHIFAAIIEALIVAGHKFLYTLLIECGRLRC